MNSQLRTLFCVLLTFLAVYFSAVAFGQKTQKKTPDKTSLSDRVKRLEEEVVKLRRELRDVHLSGMLTGHWIEDSWVRNGEIVDESEKVLGVGFGGPVEWRLASDINSQRWLLCAEPKHTSFGKFTLDSSHSPTWIDFNLSRGGESYIIRGIVRYSYGQAQLAIPTDLFDGNTFRDPARPTSFESTAENGYSVYSLQRASFDRTGVF